MKLDPNTSPERAFMVSQLGPEAYALAGKAIGRVAEHGERGLSLISTHEIAALVALTSVLGVPPMKAGKKMDPTQMKTQMEIVHGRLITNFIIPSEETRHVSK